MTEHPTKDWEWEDTAEINFQEWFNGEYGNFTFRCEWFFGDCEVEDVNTRKDLMTKWLHSAFLTGYNTGRCSTAMTEYQPTPQTPEQVAEGLRDAMRQAKEDGVFDNVVDEPEYYDEVEWDEKDNPKPMDEVVNRLLEKWKTDPPEFLKFELGKTLEDLITRWWCDVFTTHEDWDMETAIDDLVDQIQLWLPREQSHEGTQDVSVIDLVDGYNDALKKIKSKLRNKK